MHRQYFIRQCGFCQIHKMAVVGEEDDLRGLGEPPHSRICSRGALIVKVHQDIVDDEGHGAVVATVLLEAAEPDGQKELIAAAVTHFMHHERGTAWPERLDDRVALFAVIGPEPFERTAGDGFEIGGGGIQDRALVLLVIALDGPAQDDGEELQPDIVLRIRLDLSGKALGCLGNDHRLGAAADGGEFAFLKSDFFHQVFLLLEQSLFFLVQACQLCR